MPSFWSCLVRERELGVLGDGMAKALMARGLGDNLAEAFPENMIPMQAEAREFRGF